MMLNSTLSCEVEALRRELKEKDQQIERLVSRDNLTGLLNWPSTKAFLESSLESRNPVGLLYMDFDYFKVFNRTYGFILGDLLLAQFGKAVQEHGGIAGGAMGRLNGEAFLAVIPLATRERMEKLSREITSLVSELTLDMPDMPLVKADLTASMGGVLWDGSGEMNAWHLLRQADLAIRCAKKAGRGKYVLIELPNPFNGMTGIREEEQSIRLAMEIRGALDRGEFEPFYHPLYSVREQVPVSAEALVRWRHPDYGILAPDRFLPLFEDSGLIVNLDLYMFECNCRNIRRWMDAGMKVVPVFCNFSRLHFLNEGFAGQLRDTASRYGVPTGNLGIEITENMMVEDTQIIIGQIKELRRMGFSVSMDDFGSGYSSFGMLQELPVDAIKLDRIFFCRNLKDFKNTAVICAIVSIAKALGMRVICEGIETGEQAGFLRAIGCDEAQGFYYARPMECSRFEQVLCTMENGVPAARLREDMEQGFVEHVFDTFFIAQDFDRFSSSVSLDVEWHDVFCMETLMGVGRIREHFEQDIRGKTLSVIYRNMIPFRGQGSLHVSGEAVLIDEGVHPPYCRNFYFVINCARREKGGGPGRGRLFLTKLHMDMIRGESYANLFRSKEDTKTGLSRCMDESMELDAYYSMLPLGITRYELTGDMMITYMNQAMFDIIGYTREQFFEETGKNLRQLVYPDDLDIVYQNSLRMIEGENISPFEYRFIRRDGSISTVLYHQCTVKASDKRPLVQSMYIRLDLPEDAVHE